MTKELLFSVTAADCDIQFTRGSGNGGQHRNKTDTACHCKHRESGAAGYAEDSRSQLDNKRAAFKRMTQTKEFQNWHKLEVARRTGKILEIEDTVNRAMNPKNIKIEIKDENGRWIEVDSLPITENEI